MTPSILPPSPSKRDKAAEFAEAVESANGGEPPTVQEVVKYLGVSQRTVYYRADSFGYQIVNGIITKPVE